MNNPRETIKWLKAAKDNANRLTVWIGKNGCAVHDSRHAVALPIGPVTAHRFIDRAGLRLHETRADGLVYAV